MSESNPDDASTKPVRRGSGFAFLLAKTVSSQRPPRAPVSGIGPAIHSNASTVARAPSVDSTTGLGSNNSELSDSDGENDEVPIVRANSNLIFDILDKKKFNRKPRRIAVDINAQTIFFKNRTFSCYMFVNIARSSQNPAMLVVSLRAGPKTKEKKWIFKSPEEAQKFQTYIHVLKEHGQVLKKLFDAFDRRKKGWINASDLAKVCKQVEMPVTLPDIENMMRLVEKDDAGISFDEFFSFFMHSSCQTIHECVVEWVSKAVQQRPVETEQKKQGSRTSFPGDETPPKLLPGEIILNIIQHGRFTLKPRSTAPPADGNIHLTNYRMIFTSYTKSQDARHGRNEIAEAFDEFSVPLATVSRVEQPKGENSSVIIHCKDLRSVKVVFEARGTFIGTFTTFVSACAFPPEKTALFAFVYGQQDVLNDFNGWEIYDVQREFTRQGVLPSSQWRLWNDQYTLVDTYPREFLLPAMMSESDIIEAANFRSRHRLPTLTWRDHTSGALLARSSQPMVGVSKHRCMADEKLLNLYRVRGDLNDQSEMGNPSDFYIFDARKPIAATGNQFQGKGVENDKHYENTSLVFLNIENIHAMRTSLAAFTEQLAPGTVPDDDPHFWTRVEESGWLRHVRLVLEGSVYIAAKLHSEGASVLVHCSDGWDRTAQLSATPQVLLDPYFRTIEGLCVLVEKDWCTFGHKFQDRIGHADSNYQSQERSPIFVQWLEVLYQIMHQFPPVFEYTDKLLVFIADHLYSGLFGTFLGNSDRQRRVEYNVTERTRSIWSYVMSNMSAYKNPNYQPHDGPIWPSTSVRQIRIWDRYYCRWDNDMHPRAASNVFWKDDWGTDLTGSVAVRSDKLKRRTFHRISPAFEDEAGTGDAGISAPQPSSGGSAGETSPPPSPHGSSTSASSSNLLGCLAVGASPATSRPSTSAHWCYGN